MNHLLFLSLNSNYIKCNFIYCIVLSKLFNKELDPISFLTELIKLYILYSYCRNIDLNYVCIKDKNDGQGRKCKVYYLKYS